MTTTATFTKCADCAHAVEVMEPDARWVKTPSREVVQCLIYMQLRALRLVRACDSFKRNRRTA